ncbi:MAG: hypothetical protein LBT15_01695, partial [Synergistaceae bacterium]|nr:hypothetical protein [Synergistaceae bacterium]
MEFIVMDEKARKTPIATFYSEKNYAGKSQELPVGRYSFRQLSIGEPQSVKLAKNSTLAMVEKSDKSGAQTLVTEDVADFSTLPFRPAVFALARHVVAYSKGEPASTLIPGSYDVAQMKEKGIDRLQVPEGMIVRFANGESEAGAKSFEEGEVAVSEELLKFSKLYLIHKWNQSELSDAELAMVAGGKGIGPDICGGKVCGADVAVVDA